MDITEASKTVKAERPQENFMLFEFSLSYSKKLILPHKDGAALLALLNGAEVLHDGYGESKRISESSRDTCIASLFSRQEYNRYKIAALLNCTPEDVLEAQRQAAQPPKPIP